VGFDKIQYNKEYNSKQYDRLSIIVPSGKKAILQARAKEYSMSLNEFILKAVEDQYYIDGLAPKNE
jgi:hypothetical protein